MHLLRTMLFAAVALMVTLTGCSNREPGPAPDPKSTVASSKPYNDADVRFATEMIPHHAQAMVMVDLAMGRKLDPRVMAVAEDIRSGHVPEIEQLVDLLNKWDNQPIPETSRDHVNADGHGEAGTDASVPGMHPADEMEALEATKGPQFQTTWLEMMIEHHQGAIDMAVTEENEGEDETATNLASDMVESQAEQVKVMRQLLDG
jgi:uncharacterized protein (DUF305 family)